MGGGKVKVNLSGLIFQVEAIGCNAHLMRKPDRFVPIRCNPSGFVECAVLYEGHTMIYVAEMEFLHFNFTLRTDEGLPNQTESNFNFESNEPISLSFNI